MGDGQRARDFNLFDVGRAAVAFYAMGDGQRPNVHATSIRRGPRGGGVLSDG